MPKPDAERDSHDAQGLTAAGVRAEGRTGITGGCLWVSDGHANAGFMVPYAPSMPRRFEAIELDGDDVYLRRTDGVRCRIECDRVLLDQAARECATVTVTESTMDGDSRPKETYTIKADFAPENAPSRMM